MRPLTGKYHTTVYGHDYSWQKFYASRFRARRSVMLSAVNNGWTLEECRGEFANPANPGSRLWTHGDDDRLLGAAETTKRLMTDYDAAVRRALAYPATRSIAEARQYVGLVIRAVNESKWKGTTGRTDRDVMLYVCEVATDVGCKTVNVSVRDAALGAGVTRPTASRSLRRLVKAGWLIREPGDRAFCLAQAYTLRHNETYILSGSNRPICLKTAHPAQEVWIRLGKSAMNLWLALDENPQSARSLARQAGVAATTARRSLPKLAVFGLAVESQDGWSAGPLGPHEVSEHMGWFGTNSMAVYRKLDAADDRRIFRHWWGGVIPGSDDDPSDFEG